MTGDNVTHAVPEWVYRVDAPPQADPEPWRWTCPTCGSALPRDRVAGHLAVEDLDNTRSAGACLWAAGVLALLLLAAIVVVAWRVTR